MSLSEVLQAWAIDVVAITIYQFFILGIFFFFTVKNNDKYRNYSNTFFKFSTYFLSSLHIAGMMISAFGPVYSFNFLAYMTAFLSLIFLVIRDASYKFKIMLNCGSFTFAYFFNIMSIYLNNDIEQTNSYINLQSPSYMIIPAISCALQNSFFLYNYILYKYEYYGLLAVVKTFPDEDCPICLDHLSTKEVAKLKCNHYFHKLCILEHFKNNKSCPMCRTEIINQV